MKQFGTRSRGIVDGRLFSAAATDMVAVVVLMELFLPRAKTSEALPGRGGV